MPSQLVAELFRSWPPDAWCDLTVLVAVSGGADSVALLRGLGEIKQEGTGRLVVAHFNHRLRGTESDRDEAFVKDLCGRLRVEFVGGSRGPEDSLAGSRGGIEAAARLLRYRFLEATANRCGARFVATGHTANDQVETILHRILRGTGIGGLAGIPRVRALSDQISLVRPLLSVFRDQVVEYLRLVDQGYCEDATNTDRSFTRNRIRRELLPLLETRFNPRVTDAVLRLGRLASDYQAVVDEAAEALLERSCVSCREGEISLNRSLLRRAPPLVVRQMFVRVWNRQGWPRRAMSHAKWIELGAFSTRAVQEGTMTLPGNVRVRAAGEEVTLEID